MPGGLGFLGGVRAGGLGFRVGEGGGGVVGRIIRVYRTLRPVADSTP